MSAGNNKQKDKELERFLDHQIKLINEYSDGEEQFDKNLKENLHTNIKKYQINILNKDWIKKWKEIVGYEQIKEKCKKINNSTHNENLKDELYDFFIKNNIKKKFEELGKMNFPNNSTKNEENIENGNNILFNETINFIPMTGYNCSYLQKYIEKNINVSGNFYKGKCFLYKDFNIYKNKKDKIKDKKVLILEKRIGNNDEFNALVATLGEKEEIKAFINKVKNKTFEEIMNDKSLKVVKREISQNKVNEIIKNNKENEEEKKKKE